MIETPDVISRTFDPYDPNEKLEYNLWHAEFSSLMVLKHGDKAKAIRSSVQDIYTPTHLWLFVLEVILDDEGS